MRAAHLKVLAFSAGAALLGALAAPAACAADEAPAAQRGVRILVYGDSNTFGWVSSPKDADGRVTVSRLNEADTWPRQMAARLGDGFEVKVDALGGRTTDLDEPRGSGSGRIPGESFNGLATLPASRELQRSGDAARVSVGKHAA